MKPDKKDPKLTESVEDYLESVLVLSSQLPHVRSVDVASHLGFSKPSVSHAVKMLAEEGLLEVTPNKFLLLTEKGKEVAQSTYQRHVFFTDMLTSIGVDLDTAQEDACRIEHVISEETFQAIRQFYKNQDKEQTEKSE
ncbi:metal-dependent transcriptional regulator [Erysipelotrichaceae bacterium 51-3]|uniref:metal-dependent transcriptional regulator n=1 Tax=Allobaculum sp. JKK-2023 TaxID=3108943 RepID=UPI002B056C3F|nr:metal-dependent transcriptional regulator [Allobaculum sp. JKK-2023]